MPNAPADSSTPNTAHGTVPQHPTPNTLSRLDVARGLRISVWEAIWATVWTVFTTGFFQTGFALFLGATPLALGLLAAIPPGVNLLQIPAALYVERRGERRRFVAFTACAGRLLWVPIALVPFVLPPPARLPAFLFLLALSSALLAVTAPAWTSWMSDLVPPDIRGRYFARRNTLAGVVSMAVPLPASAFLDLGVKYNRFDGRIAFAVLFGLAAVSALVAAFLILRQPEPPMVRTSNAQNPEPWYRALRAPLLDAGFRPFLLFSVVTVAGQTFAGQFFMAWQVGKDGLNFPYLTAQIIGAVAALATLAVTPLWGYLSDKYGARPVLLLSSVTTAFAPLLWTFTNPGAGWVNIVLIVLLSVTSGAGWAGVGLTQFNLLLSLAPSSSRSTYVAVFSAVTGIAGGIAPLIGGALMNALEPLRGTVAGGQFNNYKILFLLTVIMRVGCAFLLRGVRTDEEAHSARYVLEQITKSARPVTSYLTVRRLQRPTGERERQETVEELGELGSPLAVEELASALDDVSPGVREGAARALGAIADSRAVAALSAKLFDPAAGVGELAADALGQIGDSEATPALIQAAHGPDAGVRVAALRALSRLADPEALPALLLALNPTHPTACEQACRALAQTVARLDTDSLPPPALEALPRLLYLLSQEVDRGVRLAAVSALEAYAEPLQRTGNQTEASTLCPRLAERLDNEADSAVRARIAVALAKMGHAGEISPFRLTEQVLPALNGLSGLARKQALEAVADAALTPGLFYPYLGMSDEARDNAVARAAGALRRPNQPSEGGAMLLEAWSSGNPRTVFATLTEQGLAPFQDTACGLAWDTLSRRAETGDATSDEALLALFLCHPPLLPPATR